MITLGGFWPPLRARDYKFELFWGDLQERIKYTSPYLATGSKRKELSRIVEKKQKRKTLTQRESETLEDHQKILECEKLKDAEQRWANG